MKYAKTIWKFIFKWSLVLAVIFMMCVSIFQTVYYSYLWNKYHITTHATQNTPDYRLLGLWNIPIFILEYGLLLLGFLNANQKK